MSKLKALQQLFCEGDSEWLRFIQVLRYLIKRGKYVYS